MLIIVSGLERDLFSVIDRSQDCICFSVKVSLLCRVEYNILFHFNLLHNTKPGRGVEGMIRN